MPSLSKAVPAEVSNKNIDPLLSKTNLQPELSTKTSYPKNTGGPGTRKPNKSSSPLIDGLSDLGKFPAQRKRQPSKSRLSEAARSETGGKESQSIITLPSTANITNLSRNGTTTPGQEPAKQIIIWPEAKLRALAAAAERFLKQDPTNALHSGISDIVLSVLRSNPSYRELCTHLESRGYKIQRQEFAKCLLQAAPDLGEKKGTASAINIQASPILQTSLEPSNYPPLFASQPFVMGSSSAADSMNSQERNTQIVTKQLSLRKDTPQKVQRGNSPDTASQALCISPIKSMPNPDSQPKTHGTPLPAKPFISKEASANKRLFSEIVDLSALSDDEVEMAPSTTNVNAPSDLSRFSYASSEETKRETLRRQAGLADLLNPAEALNRSYYNPKTIARDILIAAGRHPDERPLNHHLLKLQEVFSSVGQKSDLSTFRWDLVDPGGPPMPIREPEDILAFPPTIPHRKRRRRTILPVGEPRDSNHVDSPSATHPHHAVFQTVQHPSPETPNGQRQSGQHTMAQETSNSPARRHGRPPGAKNENLTKKQLRASDENQVKVMVPIGATVPDLEYPVFKCEWVAKDQQGCPAKLHGIHTLERHVAKIHLPGSTSCRWKGCASERQYSHMEGLRKHMMHHHIQPVAWRHGDGPAGNGTGERTRTSPRRVSFTAIRLN